MNDDDAQLSDRMPAAGIFGWFPRCWRRHERIQQRRSLTTISPVRARQLHDQKEEESDEPKARVDE